MRPYVIVTADFVRTGGMDVANFGLAQYLAKRGNEVHLVAHQVDAELTKYPNVIFHHVPKPADSYLLGSRVMHRVGLRVAHRLQKRGARVIVNGGNCDVPDVNWVHYVHAGHTPENRASSSGRAKQYLAHRIFAAEERRILPRARVVIANSDRTRQDLIDRLQVSPERVRTVYYGVDAKSFFPAPPEQRSQLREQLGLKSDECVLVFVGALSDRRKGFDVLFDAFCQLATTRDGLRLLVVGRGEELPRWQERARASGRPESIQFLGFRADVPRILRACDLLVAPTRYEAYGLGVHEALCCGIPSIVSASAGVAERYPLLLRPLLLENPNDAQELRQRVDLVLNRLEVFRTLTHSLSDELRTHSWDEMAKQFVSQIEL